MARYELDDGKSQKFWEIEVEGSTFTVRYGRIGTNGQSKTKVFSSPEEASKEAEKITKSKVKKGYAPVVAVVRAEPGRNPALEQAIVEDSDNPDPWRVYADWLMGEGDPRGDFVMAFANETDTEALLKANEKAFMGPFAGEFAPFVKVEWAFGFWKSLAFGNFEYEDELPEGLSSFGALIGRALRHPSARFLQELRLGLPADQEYEHEWQDSINAIVKNGIRRGVKRLVVGDFEYPDDTEISWTNIGSLADLWSVLPDLEHLEVQGGNISLGAMEAPRLKHLELRTGGLPKEPAERIAQATLPALERLDIWWGTDEYGLEGDVSHAAAVLEAAARWPKLKSLGLMNSEFADAIPAQVVSAAVLPQLQVLNLSMGTMTDAGAQVLLDNADKLVHLTQLNLNENFITDDVAAQLAKALPNATLEGQEEPDEYLFVSVGE
ncbi:MAG: WGR domain-containing protein [Myxococcota bacterium]